jgi:hypothetical protein
VQKFSEVIDLWHHARTPLINGTELSYWTSQDPQVIPRHDVKYLQSSELVPTYSGVLDPATTTFLPTKYAPLQQGNFTYDGDSMASPGYQHPIGLLPNHDVAYLVCADPCPAYQGVVRNGYSAGRYPIHYRDEKTLRPLRFSEYPSLVIGDGCGFKDNGASSGGTTPVCSGGGRSWDTAHSPSVGYMAYLLTGRWYFMEEVQFAATTNFLGLTNTEIMRGFSAGIFHPVAGAFQTRAAAWTVRTLIQALTVTPDDDSTLRNEFKNSWEANINYYYSRYIAQPNNPFGFVAPAEEYDARGLGAGAAWQQDFITAVWGYAVSLNLPVSTANVQKTAEFFQWKARSVVGRLGVQGEFWYVNGAPYVMSFSPSSNPDYAGGKGPWYSNWTEIYNATYATPFDWQSKTEGVLAAEYTIDSWARSMWGNTQPAISYAVRHRVPGASAAYDRMTHASNWKELASYFNASPVWSVKPAR